MGIRELLYNSVKFERGFQKLRPKIQCVDGFTMSVQASEFHYCSPRESGKILYNEVEIGFPSSADDLISEYAESPEVPTESVYGYVPVSVVDELIVKHGGLLNVANFA